MVMSDRAKSARDRYSIALAIVNYWWLQIDSSRISYASKHVRQIKKLAKVLILQSGSTFKPLVLYG